MKNFRGFAIRFLVLAMVAVFVSMIVFAATDSDEVYNHGIFMPGSTVYLFADKVNIRSNPNTSAKIVHSLPIGSKLTIIGEPEGKYLANGFESGWYKVRFAGGEKYAEGYVWGGLLALGSVEFGDPDDLTLVLPGICKYGDGPFVGELRIVKAGSIVAKVEFKWIFTNMSSEPVYCYTTKVEELTWTGVVEIKRMFQIDCHYDACGYNRGKLLFFWDGKTLYSGPIAMGISEAGVFSVNSDFIFPGQENLKPDELMVRTITTEYGEDEENPIPAKKTKVEELYVWKGKNWDKKETVETELPVSDQNINSEANLSSESSL